jgi:pseudaminic acid biosynthesis-associated methylase
MTEQERFWAGKFGSDYIERNRGAEILASNLGMFSQALRSAVGVKTCTEIGPNIGMNLAAIKLLHPEWEQYAVEINADAIEELANVIPAENITNKSIVGYVPSATDLVITCCVLIHIAPESLPSVYDSLVAATNKYLLIAEYYNPTPVAIDYRGHDNKLFKRDFAREILERHPQMRLADYGFVYNGDPNHPKDDITWFLLEHYVEH